MDAANWNLLSAKFVSVKICKRPIHENVVPHKFGTTWCVYSAACQDDMIGNETGGA